MKIETGKPAPDFSLFDTDKKKVNLTDFNDKNVLLLFFPQAFTSTCTKELCAVRDDISRYSNTNAQVIGISVDSAFTLAKFKEENDYAFPLLSDFNKVVSKEYDAFLEKFVLGMKGVSARATFVIDTGGVVVYAEVLPNAGELPNFAAIRQSLEKN